MANIPAEQAIATFALLASVIESWKHDDTTLEQDTALQRAADCARHAGDALKQFERVDAKKLLLHHSVDDLEISIRLQNILREEDCYTVADAAALLDKPVWAQRQKAGRELHTILKSIGVRE